jgi:hypothetical protein
MAAAEAARGNEPDPEKRKYPGGAFDPLGFSKDAKACPLPCSPVYNKLVNAKLSPDPMGRLNTCSVCRPLCLSMCVPECGGARVCACLLPNIARIGLWRICSPCTNVSGRWQ